MPMPLAFRRLWLAGAVDNIGDGAFLAAIPLLAVTITHDPRLVSVVSAATTLPWLLVSLPVGALVDRRDRVGLMWRSQVVQTVIVVVVAVLAASGRAGIVDLGALAFLMGCCEVVFGNASQSVLPQLVPKELLHKANGQQYAAQTAGALFVGPPLGSLLFGLAVWLPFGANAASFAISAALLASLPRTHRERGPHPAMWRSVAEGMRWLRGSRLLRKLALLLGIATFCGQLGNATMVLLATQTLHVSDRGYGVLLAAAAVGAVTGGLVNARVVHRIGEPAALLTSMGAMAVSYLGIGLAPDPAVMAIFMAGNGLFVTMWNVVTVSLRQELVPTELLGRVNSVYRMLGWGFMPLGAICGGFIAHGLGLRAPYVVAFLIRGAVLVLAGPALLRESRAVRAPVATGARAGSTPRKRDGSAQHR
jgi:MFS family permease